MGRQHGWALVLPGPPFASIIMRTSAAQLWLIHGKFSYEYYLEDLKLILVAQGIGSNLLSLQPHLWACIPKFTSAALGKLFTLLFETHATFHIKLK